MKHLLPVLTLALLGAVATASAENFYYDYYKNPGKSELGNEYLVRDDGWNVYESQTDTFTYKNFAVARNSDWAWVGSIQNGYVTDKADIDNTNFYRIHVLGEEGSKVNLYLTDFVDNAGSDNNASALYRNLELYGYRTLTLVDGRYVATGDTQVFSPDTKTVIDSVDIEKEQYDESGTALENPESYTVTRYQYSLGTFDAGAAIEIYMKDLKGGEAYSYSNINETIVDKETNVESPAGPEGGFGDGGYRPDGNGGVEVVEETDELMHDYYYQDEQMLAAGLIPFTTEEARVDAANKSMPLSALDPSGTRLYFGIFASAVTIIDDNNGGEIGGGNGTFGSPLPGGLQLALIAGLFGLGLGYVRRRKAFAE